MNIESLRQYCLAKAGTTEGFPFDNETLVIKVLGKMFALIPMERHATVNLKCDPEYALELRDRYPESVLPGYHMSKKHWNTLHYLHLPEDLVRSLIDHSYELVVSKLPKRDQAKLQDS